MACPECGEELGLIDHKIIWHDENTVTVEPSIQHEKYGEAGAQVLHLQCGAHFFIKNNEILDSNGQVIDYKQYPFIQFITNELDNTWKKND